MMDLFGNLGPHAQFIVIAYAIAAATMAALIGWVWLDYRAQKAALDDLESRGITRRSARASEKTA
jgi:heme exporter protein D